MSRTIRNPRHSSVFRRPHRNKAVPPSSYDDIQISGTFEDWFWFSHFWNFCIDEPKTHGEMVHHQSKKNVRKSYNVARNLKAINHEETTV
mgnify:CR=1 FL=1|jgi:hypothetical protein